MSLQLVQTVPRAQIPHPQTAVIRATDGEAIYRRSCVEHRVCMSLQLVQTVPRAQIPHPQAVVI